ncbi:MAG: hypothetical protein M5R42_01920 [Rhodocyclaceae bacterium]|nr:hypothetical protein [Rhodocyclaceae bacterium]
MLLSGERADMTQQFGDAAGAKIFVSSIGAKCTRGGAAHPAPHPLTRPRWPGA